MPGAKTVVGIDVGGTMVKGMIAAGDPSSGEPVGDVQCYRWPTPRAHGPQAVVASVLDAVDELMNRSPDADGVGIVVAGLVDDEAGVARYSENIKWHDVPFKALLGERTGLPVGFGHDVRAGGMAEWTLGAGRGVSNVLFMPIGTGVSGAMLIDGRPMNDPYAGEIGHIDVGFDIDCACGARGCLEAVGSAAAIARRYRQASGVAVPGAKEVLAQLQHGDRIARRVWDDALTALARALATYVSLLAPELIVLGGGLACAGEALFQPLRKRLQALLVWQKMPRLAPAALGDNAACYGALLLAQRAASCR